MSSLTNVDAPLQSPQVGGRGLLPAPHTRHYRAITAESQGGDDFTTVGISAHPGTFVPSVLPGRIETSDNSHVARP